MIAAITSCTNTSNPSVMIAAGLLAQKAVERGLERRPWVKSSLAPGSKVVSEYYRASGLDKYLDELGFNTVGYGCTTCIGNSGPLPEPISAAVADGDLVVCAVLSGNRNFEARIHGEVKANYLASPPLVVAYALAGRMDLDLVNEPLGQGSDGEDVFLRDLWPSREEIDQVIGKSVKGEMFSSTYADVFTGDDRWRALETPEGELYEWDDASTYVRLPPYFEGMPREPEPVADVEGARCLVLLGDSVTTDHISPAGAIRPDSPAGKYLTEHGVERREFNSYGARRGNHEVMVRGTFANVRLKNLLVPGSEGTWTVHLPDGEEGTIFEVAERYRAEGVPTIVIAGKEYGSGSSRDWAAKGPNLLGVRAAIADSYERIHRSNLLMMGIAPLQFMPGENAESLGLTRPRGVLDHRARGRRRRRGHGAGGRQGVPRPSPARHAARAGVLPPRRHPPVRAETPAFRVEPDRAASSSPEVAARQDVDERHDREEHEDGPGELLAAAQIIPAGEVDPREHDRKRVQEANEDFEELLHACRSPGRSTLIRRPAAATYARPVGEPLRTLELPDGRTLAYATWGDPDGFPVLSLHGTPGCRLNRWPNEDVYVGPAPTG